MNLLKFKINPGQEMMQIITAEFAKLNLQTGAIVSVIGAVDECCLSNMPKENAKKDILTTYKQPFELSGVGEIKDGKPHIHCVLGKEGDQTLSGHLHWAKVENWYVTVFVAAE